MQKTEQIYVRLLGLKYEQWRIADALRLSTEVYQLCGPVPDGEHWEFQPGQVVLVDEVVLTLGGYGLLAVSTSTHHGT